jgi:hypothetical protein
MLRARRNFNGLSKEWLIERDIPAMIILFILLASLCETFRPSPTATIKLDT